MRSSLFRAAVGAVLSTITIGAWAQLPPPPTEAELRAAGATPMQADALPALLNDKTIYHTNLHSGQQFALYYRPDGRRFIKLGSTIRNTKWWIQDGMRCEDSIASRATVCQKIYKQGDLYRMCTVGESACNWVVSFEPGDTEGIGK
jgi:hypothetical protein